MIRPLRVALLMLAFSCSCALAQGTLVHNRLRVISSGKQEDVEKVRREIPELLREYPDDPGVMFLNGILMDDGTKALVAFEQITREYPQCEWADDAQWRIVQYYALKRDTLRANRELNNYRRNYPMSEFLIHAVDIVKATVGLHTLSTDTKKTTAAEKPTEKPSEKITEKVAEKNVGKNPEKSSEKSPSPVKPAPSSVSPSSAANSVLVESKPNGNNAVHPSTTASKSTTKEPAKPATTKESAPAVTPATSASTKYGLQIGVYSTVQKAEAEAQKYKEARLRVDIIPKKTSDSEGFAVVIGNYSTRESAEKSKEVVQTQCQCTPYIIEK